MVRKQVRLKIHSKAIRVINTYTAALVPLNIYKYFSFVIEIKHKRECISGKITTSHIAEIIHSLISSEACDHSK